MSMQPIAKFEGMLRVRPTSGGWSIWWRDLNMTVKEMRIDSPCECTFEGVMVFQSAVLRIYEKGLATIAKA